MKERDREGEREARGGRKTEHGQIKSNPEKKNHRAMSKMERNKTFT